MTRKYPVGIQTFDRLRRDGYIYVDKTDLVWRLAHYATYIFMSRPRRFGKSLLTTTLDSYFKGDKELFQGLKIMDLETEWEKYPVIHLDLSSSKGRENTEELRRSLRAQLSYIDGYSKDDEDSTPGEILTAMIRRLNRETGSQVVVIVDEYDAPLLEVLHEGERLDAFRKVLQELYVPLKANEAYIKFCFITGITKFSQLSIFSTINNLMNVTLLPEFSTICGITEEELDTTLAEDVAILAERNGVSPEKMRSILKTRYDGYHFSENPVGVYNPFSLMKCFLSGRVDNYWFDSGTPSYLIRQLRKFKADITSMDRIEVPASAFDQPTENMRDALPLLYQSGYLTIKDYDREANTYTLSIPNQEVRIGYTEGLLPTYTGLDAPDVQMGFALKFWRALKADDIDLAMRHMQAYLAGIPYVEGFKEKLKEAATVEGFYEYTFYLIFSMLNVYVRTQVKCAGGRSDIVVHMPDTTYVLELKAGGAAEEALAQINSKGYALPYGSDGKAVVKVGVAVDKDKRTVQDWLVER